MHAVVSFYAIVPVVVMVVRIGKVVFSFIFMYPCGFMKVYQTFHDFHFSIQFHHIIFQFASLTNTATAIVDICLAVIIHKDTRIYQRIHSFDISLYGEVCGRFFAGGYSDFPTSVPVRIAGVGEIKVIRAVFVGTIRCPHESAFFTSPRYLRRIQNFTMIRPVHHVVGRKHMISVH